MKYDDIKPEKNELYGLYAVLAFSQTPLIEIKDQLIGGYLDPAEPNCYLELRKENDYLIKRNKFFSDFELETGHLYVFKIQKEDLADYHNFINGKWSELSDSFCKKMEKLGGLPRFKKVDHKTGSYLEHLIFSIIYKTESYKEKLEKALSESIPENVELYGTPRLENFKTLDEFFIEHEGEDN